MRMDLIEVKTKNNKKQIVVIVLIALFFIISFSILGIKCAEYYNNKIVSQKRQQYVAQKETQVSNTSIESISENETAVNDSNNETIKNNKGPIPVYSASAKKKMDNIYKVNQKIAYLTFDDGPSKNVTPYILDYLKKENIKVTFFVLGSRAKSNKSLVKREYEEGHYIANHGYSHNYSSIYAKKENVLKEYNKTEKIIQEAIGNPNYSSNLFRFPGGSNGGRYSSVKKAAQKMLENKNIAYIDWNALTNDAAGANTKQKMMKSLKSTVKNKNNVVILMHDASDKILTYEILPDVISYLKKQGYTFDNFYSIMK